MKLYHFSEVISDVTSKFNKIKASEYKLEGHYKIIDQGQREIAGYTDDESLVTKTHSPIIVFGDHTRVLKYVDNPIALGADGAKALSVNSKLGYTRYVYYFLKSINLKGAGYSRHFKFLKQVEIPLPPLDDQKRIAHLLCKVEGMIARRKQHLLQLDELLKSVFLEMFGDPVRNEKGWEKNRIGKSIKVQGGYAFKSKDLLMSGAVKIVKIANVHFENLVWDDVTYVPENYLEEFQKFSLKPNDLLIALTRPVIKSLDVVKTATVRKSDLPCLLNQRVARFNIDESVFNKKFFLQYCYSTFFKNTIDTLCPPGLQPNVSTGQIENIPIYYPPINLQNKFAAIVEKVESLKSRYQSSLSNLENLYGALSQKAFKGELDLSRVPLQVEEKTAKPEEVPVLPFDEGLSETMKKTLADLNKFNNSSASLRALQEAAAINLDSPAMKAAQMLAEQARLWKNPLDELKNMSSISRAMEELAKPSALQQIAKEHLEAFRSTSKLAQQLAASLPKIDMSFIEQQKKLIESASRPFIEMQKTLANLNLARTTLAGVMDDSEAVARRFQSAIPDFASWQQQYSTPEDIDTETEEEEEPKHIFTRYDITDALAGKTRLSFDELANKLSELEKIDLSAYERIRNILFELLGEGVLTQQFDEESQLLQLRLAE